MSLDWIENHGNVSLSIVSGYRSIFCLVEIFDGFGEIKFRYLEKDGIEFVLKLRNVIKRGNN